MDGVDSSRNGQVKLYLHMLCEIVAGTALTNIFPVGCCGYFGRHRSQPHSSGGLEFRAFSSETSALFDSKAEERKPRIFVGDHTYLE